ncbi:MAG: hypothetical protein JKY54_07360 [Flavobacteriales bacterium]|nr:hypothetical protein [Flavobacteriales bacterium]
MKLFKIIALSSIITLAFFSCSKDQKYVRWIGDGDWTRTSVTLNGVEMDLGGTLTEHTQTHDVCKVKKGDCTGSNSYTLELTVGGTLTGSSTFTYKVHEKGTKITYTVLTSTTNGVTSDCTSGCVTEFDIDEISKDKHILATTDANGDVWVRTMEKK